MPRIKRFDSTEIALFFADHPPPHFHVLGRDGAAQVAIETLEILAVTGRLNLQDALTWASENQELLRQEWVRLSGDQT
jgi:hypothetical protein